MSKILVHIIILSFFTLSVFAQQYSKSQLQSSKQERHTKIKYDSTSKESWRDNRIIPLNIKNPSGTIDTLSYRESLPGSWSTNFGYYSQDVILQWFQAPADMTILEIGFTTAENFDNTLVGVAIVKLNLTREEIMNAGELNWGYYPSVGDSFNNIAPFKDEATAPWVSLTSDTTEIFGDFFLNCSDSDTTDCPKFLPEASPVDSPVYQFINLSDVYGQVPEILQGDIFGIALKNLSTSSDSSRIGIWAQEYPAIQGFKYYENGRFTPTNGIGWWTQKYVLDISVVVDFPERPFVRIYVTQLHTTLSTEPREVQATALSPIGILSMSLMYSIDLGLSFTEVPMDSIDGGIYSAEIPGQIPGSEIRYFAKAIDIDGIEWNSGQYSYKIFKKESDILFLYNGSDFGQGTASFFYIGDGTAEPLAHDFWSVSNDGVAELDVLLALYDNVLQIDGSFPDADVSANIAAWIATGTAGKPKAYLQSSQDFGCFITGDCSDISFAAGSFMYDIMGVESLAPQDFSGGNNDDWQILGVDADPISGWVNTYATANGVDYWYNSKAELGFTNWFDNIVPAPRATTIFTESSTGNVVGVRNDGVGWYTSFLAYDYLGANFLSDTSITPLFDDPGYAWGIKVASQAFQFFTWAGVVSVERENNLLPDEYNLSQNYPNPFNPETVIRFQLPTNSNVQLKVYDILGREVATLVNKEFTPGKYEVKLNASDFSSGIYFYQLRAESSANTGRNFVQTKKMILLK